MCGLTTDRITGRGRWRDIGKAEAAMALETLHKKRPWRKRTRPSSRKAERVRHTRIRGHTIGSVAIEPALLRPDIHVKLR
jgi:hypothetical protein